MPHRQQGAPKGCVTVRVGAEGEDQRRFAVPLGHLSHPLFAALLEEAEREYGFRHQGAIAIPCRVDRFVHVEQLIDRDLGDHRHLVDLDNCAATVNAAGGHGHGHSHINLPRFVGCFRD
ncbi:auxin-responsive protein SAUR32-like [Lolium rigidum]|uniref:auxin-responsive protein SAUR32-like n=1 Tax=Lolium rigidum TaxID=89674 RepID=UPI001F5D904C|nr:auxin-responsive protein SAUR32-like [Lolium rigidum]